MIVLGLDAGANTGVAVLDTVQRALFRYKWHGLLDRADRAGHLETIIQTWSPTLVVVEAPVGHAYRGQAARVANLIDAARIAGGLADRARKLGIHVIETSATATRKSLCGKGSASDTLVRHVVLMRVRDWPLISNNHTRDAAVAAMYGAVRIGLPKVLGGAA